jgi:hypothetical protein
MNKLLLTKVIVFSFISFFPGNVLHAQDDLTEEWEWEYFKLYLEFNQDNKGAPIRSEKP